ncbi:MULTISPECIES: nitrogenase stabilizing/protective protein NifW [Rhizobium]|jgi:nitrogenase-stabilizing/protective protein|uniref:Nitrogenase-stabilizing/protective protein NifW n=6 Tax=Rhizobium TaxID=379 RepID=NIFW_RHIEC|nr:MULTISPECIES: nitrogenase stabilizing/protective protein NifW [Rhizobium]Q8KLB6.1 RecName: Full=Nitrogenase-stabilizing/protective protein NifW [Rhizobium etli CFN 42]EGE56436.1 nitrogenase stabilizing/protective protein [Rhizobium etli CNPAF512]KEC70685.1 nitrogenase stabilizing/protective protein [Rhizobium leguminosarum bv. phaseoli CCGM1]AAM54828.1 nitrogenase stabilizing/protective protein [Rhizobium etli CFN 42]ANM07027.1 nitrogenase stabilizing/protective protein NifW [Rhizobium phas
MCRCSADSSPVDVKDILNRLKSLSAAEEFFEALGVPYDPKVLDVSRLHIMKRMGQYLAAEDFSHLPDRVIAARARAILERAYCDFATSAPLSHRVFKVLKDHNPNRPVTPGRTVVPLDSFLKPFEKK